MTDKKLVHWWNINYVECPMAVLDKYVKPPDKKYSENRIDWIIGYLLFLSSSYINHTVFTHVLIYATLLILYLPSFTITGCTLKLNISCHWL